MKNIGLIYKLSLLLICLFYSCSRDEDSSIMEQEQVVIKNNLDDEFLLNLENSYSSNLIPIGEPDTDPMIIPLLPCSWEILGMPVFDLKLCFSDHSKYYVTFLLDDFIDLHLSGNWIIKISISYFSEPSGSFVVDILDVNSRLEETLSETCDCDHTISKIFCSPNIPTNITYTVQLTNIFGCKKTASNSKDLSASCY